MTHKLELITEVGTKATNSHGGPVYPVTYTIKLNGIPILIDYDRIPVTFDPAKKPVPAVIQTLHDNLKRALEVEGKATSVTHEER